MSSTLEQLEDIKWVPTICPYCGCGCGLYLIVKGGRIVGVEPWKEHPVSEGKLCPKGRNAYEFLYAKDRLRKPLVRRNGELVEASWDEAIGRVAEEFGKASPDEFGVLASGKTTNEEGYVLQKFARIVMKTNNIDYCARFCHSTTVGGLGPTVGSGVMEASVLDYELPDCFIIAGVNIHETFPAIARRVRRAKKHGAKVIVIDPRRTLTAKLYADIHLQLAPGTDVALVNGMMRIILDEGLENRKFIEERTVGFEELREHLLKLDLEEVEKVTRVPLEKIREAALTYAQAEDASILYDEGITEYTTGVDKISALADLAMLTGQVGKPGCGVNPMRGQITGEGTGDMGCLPVFYPGFKRLEEETFKFFKEAWGVDELPEKPGKTTMEMLETCKQLYIVGFNIMVSAPDINNVRRMLEEKDFVVVQDILMTETAKLADVVLPAAAWAEKTGVHAWTDRRVQLVRKAVDPPGEAMPDWQIICKIAERMGYGKYFNYGSSRDIFDEIRRCVPQYKGITYERLEKSPQGIQWPCPSEDHPGTPTMFVERFGTPDGLGHFKVVEYKPPAELPDGDYPLMLTTGRVIFHYHTGTMTRRTRRLNGEIPTGYVAISEGDARRYRVRNGDKVYLVSRRGRVMVEARVSDEVPEGLLFMPFHFSECAANLLTNPALAPGAKMPEFKLCAVKIEKEGDK